MFSEQRYLGKRGNPLHICITALAGLDFLLYGYDQGLMGGLLFLQSFTKTFPEIDTTRIDTNLQEKQHASVMQGITVSSYNVGCLVGALACIFIGDVLGRRKSIFLGILILIMGAILQCSAFNLAQLITGRVISGLGNGLNTATFPMWQCETSPGHKRGQMIMVGAILITAGVGLSYFISLGFSYLDPSSISWRFPIAFQILLALIICLLILELPESPRWLILKGQADEATTVLAALNDTSTEHSTCTMDVDAIKESVVEMSRGTVQDLFTMDENRHLHRTAIAFMTQVFQQIAGINLITFYAAIIYKDSLHLSNGNARLMALGGGVVYGTAAFMAFKHVEKFGRRPLMLSGAAGMSVSMAVLAGLTHSPTIPASWAAAIFLWIFNAFFAIGWLGIAWLYPVEIVPLRIRAPANALSTAAMWAFSFLIVMITPIAFETIKYKTYIIFAVINALIFVMVYLFFPETGGRSLEEICSIFRSSKGWFDVVKLAESMPRRYGKNGEVLIDFYPRTRPNTQVPPMDSQDGLEGSLERSETTIYTNSTKTSTNEKEAERAISHI